MVTARVSMSIETTQQQQHYGTQQQQRQYCSRHWVTKPWCSSSHRWLLLWTVSHLLLVAWAHSPVSRHVIARRTKAWQVLKPPQPQPQQQTPPPPPTPQLLQLACLTVRGGGGGGDTTDSTIAATASAPSPKRRGRKRSKSVASQTNKKDNNDNDETVTAPPRRRRAAAASLSKSALAAQTNTNRGHFVWALLPRPLAILLRSLLHSLQRLLGIAPSQSTIPLRQQKQKQKQQSAARTKPATTVDTKGSAKTKPSKMKSKSTTTHSSPSVPNKDTKLDTNTKSSSRSKSSSSSSSSATNKKKNTKSPSSASAAAARHLQTELALTNPNYRIQRELKAFLSDPPPHLSVRVGKNIRVWIITIRGADNTLYANETFQLRVSFPPRYPTVPPSVYFLPPHIPVHEHVYTNGDICLSLLGKDWRPNLTAQAIAQSILSILSSAPSKTLPMDNAQHANNKPGQYQKDWVYHDDNC